MMKRTPLFRGAKAKNTEYLKLRYTEKDEQVHIKSKDTWVALEKHPVMKRFAKAKPVAMPSS